MSRGIMRGLMSGAFALRVSGRGGLCQGAYERSAYVWGLLLKGLRCWLHMSGRSSPEVYVRRLLHKEPSVVQSYVKRLTIGGLCVAVLSYRGFRSEGIMSASLYPGSFYLRRLRSGRGLMSKVSGR